ncbi:MAG: serine/threonine-protein kinase [Planctomycetota bacterium]
MLREVGDGVSGRVFQARREADGAIVAIKVLRHAEWLFPDKSSNLAERFQREQAILGRLEHPGIAAFLGVAEAQTPLGSAPCLVMGFVDGQPLQVHCDAFDLDDHARIEILASVCDAVQHAHERGILHRDLKPANVLVGAAGRPVVVDFGVARATGVDGWTTLAQTRQGDVLGTLGYMSPEQASGHQEVDARTDVYALGAMLFELLTGQLPQHLQGLSLTEALRRIAHDPIEALDSLKPDVSTDLATIVGRALEKDAADRYSTAAALAADLRRFLCNQAIEARPPGAWEQLRKFARRNPRVVTGVALVFVALVLGMAGLAYGVWQAKAREAVALRGQEEAVRAAERFGEIVGVLGDVVEAPQLGQRGYDVRVSDLLQDLSERLRGSQAWGTPALFRLHRGLGHTFASLGWSGEAVEHLEQATKLAHEGGRESDWPELQTELAEEWLQSGDAGQAADVLMDLRTRLAGELEAGDSQRVRADVQMVASLRIGGHHAQAMELAEEIWTRVNADETKDDLSLGRAAHALASCLVDRGEWERAEELERTTLAAYQRLEPAQETLMRAARSSLGVILRSKGQAGQAELLYRDALNDALPLYGERHPVIFHIQEGLGTALKHQLQYPEAVEMLGKAASGFAEFYGEAHPDALIAKELLGQAIFDSGDPGRGGEIQMQVAQLRVSSGQDSSLDAMRTFNATGALLSRMGRNEEAADWMERAASIAARRLPEGNPQRLQVEGNLAQMQFNLGRMEQAEQAFRNLMPHVDTLPARGLVVRANFGRLLRESGRAEEALPWLEQAVELADQLLPKGLSERARIRIFLGEALRDAGQVARAREVLSASLAEAEGAKVPNPKDIERAREDLAGLPPVSETP